MKDEQITTRQFRVSSEENVLGDPLSRGPKYMSLFKKNARDQGATSFVRMEIPPMILRLLDELAELHPEVVRVEDQQRTFRLQKPIRQRRSPSPSATAQDPSPARPHSLHDLGISRSRWRYVANFAGLDTMLEVAGELGGSPACGADNHGPARAFWQGRTGRVCFANFATFREMVADPEQRAHHLDRVLVYLSGPPCIDFSIAGGQLGTGGDTGQLFLDDADCALETDAPIVVSEIVLGILDPHLKVFLERKVATLREKYIACWRILRCNRHGDKFTNRRRIFIVGIKREFLRCDIDPDTVELFPPDRPAEGSPGLGAIIDPAANEDVSLRFEDLSRIQWLPPRTVPHWYGGLRLIAKVDGSDRIGHHIYDPAGSASTIRTDGDGPGVATGLYMFGDTCRCLSAREAARTHSISETTYNKMERFVTELTAEPERRNKELFRLIGNSIPVMTLRDVVRHLLSLLNW